MLDEGDQALAHSLRTVVLPQLGEGELEEEGEALDQGQSTGSHGVKVLEDEVPHLRAGVSK